MMILIIVFATGAIYNFVCTAKSRLEVFDMRFLDNPNLPGAPVSLAAVDARISNEAEAALGSMGIELLKVRPHPDLYEAVSGHPDMLLHPIGGELIVYAPGTDKALLDALTIRGFKLLKGETELASSYPADIAYNVARVGGWYFHNLKFTDPVVKRQLDKCGVEPVHVGQGYSKCSVLPVNEHAILTTDKGIARAAEKKGLDVLFMADEGAIRLPGLNRGFIGGTGGMAGKSVCVLNGDPNKLDCSGLLADFASENDIIIKSLSHGQVTDIGSILPLTTI